MQPDPLEREVTEKHLTSLLNINCTACLFPLSLCRPSCEPAKHAASGLIYLQWSKTLIQMHRLGSIGQNSKAHKREYQEQPPPPFPWCVLLRLKMFPALSSFLPFCIYWFKSHQISPPIPPSQQKSHLAKFSVTFRSASCFFARFLAATSLAILSPNLSRRPGSRIYKYITHFTCQGSRYERCINETKHFHGWIAAENNLNWGGVGSAHSSLLLHKSKRGHREIFNLPLQVTNMVEPVQSRKQPLHLAFPPAVSHRQTMSPVSCLALAHGQPALRQTKALLNSRKTRQQLQSLTKQRRTQKITLFLN